MFSTPGCNYDAQKKKESVDFGSLLVKYLKRIVQQKYKVISKMEMNYIDKARYHTLISRYNKFKEHMGDPNKEEIKVFDTLSKKQLEELMVIREVTEELNKKLQEDLKKASAQAAAEIEAEKEKPVENTEPATTEQNV